MATVLVVEDDENNRNVLTRFLAREGYEVVQAADGEAGVGAVRAHRPDVILMDLNLPVIDGWEAIRQIKSDSESNGIPIVVLTAHATADDVVKALSAGCDHYETKPLVYPRLMRKIRSILRQG